MAPPLDAAPVSLVARHSRRSSLSNNTPARAPARSSGRLARKTAAAAARVAGAGEKKQLGTQIAHQIRFVRANSGRARARADGQTRARARARARAARFCVINLGRWMNDGAKFGRALRLSDLRPPTEEAERSRWTDGQLIRTSTRGSAKRQWGSCLIDFASAILNLALLECSRTWPRQLPVQ